MEINEELMLLINESDFEDNVKRFFIEALTLEINSTGFKRRDINSEYSKLFESCLDMEDI